MAGGPEGLSQFKKSISSGREPATSGLQHTALTTTLPRSCLRHYATSRKVVGSNPDEVIGFFN
jgi:hypothetical protein